MKTPVELKNASRSRNMPKTETDLQLTPAEAYELLRLAFTTYRKQAHHCYIFNAPLAGCIMAGAAVEAVLTAVTCMRYDEALKTGKAPKCVWGKRRGEPKELLNWNFLQLLNVAKHAKWLPEELTLAEHLDSREVKTPVRTDSIRAISELMHPARYLKNKSGGIFSIDELHILYATCNAALDVLQREIPG
jgi:hypothetical protein